MSNRKGGLNPGVLTGSRYRGGGYNPPQHIRRQPNPLSVGMAQNITNQAAKTAQSANQSGNAQNSDATSYLVYN